MRTRYLTYIFILLVTLAVSCGKKIVPASAPSAETKAAPVKKIKIPVPKSIVVNDAAAKKTIDGRLYYDLNGKRYWRNNKDGKYYLFNKAMYSDPAFSP